MYPYPELREEAPTRKLAGDSLYYKLAERGRGSDRLVSKSLSLLSSVNFSPAKFMNSVSTHVTRGSCRNFVLLIVRNHRNFKLARAQAWADLGAAGA